MADSASTDPSEIYKTLLAGFTVQSAVEEAIQKGLKSFVETADAEVNKLVQSNTLPPDVSAEMLALQKAMIEKTIKLIQQSGPDLPSKE